MARGLRSHWPVLLPAFVYLYAFPYLPELRSPNELSRLYQARALVDHGTLEVNQVLAEQGQVGDLSCVAVARDEANKLVGRRPCPEVRGQAGFSEEHYFPSKAPLLSVAAAPVYAALKAWRAPQPVHELGLVYFARLFVTVLPSIVLLVPLRRFLRACLSPEVADALTVSYALGTLAFSYSELFMSHQLTAVLLFGVFFALFRLRRGKWSPRGYVWAGLFAGAALASEYTAALALLPLAVYGLWDTQGRWRGRLQAAAWGLVGLLPVVTALAGYHQLAFGHPLQSGYDFLNDAAYQGWHRGGFLGIRLPDVRALFLSFFSPLRGLLILSPFLGLALLGFARRFWSRELRLELALSLALLVVYGYFTSSFAYESWGWTTGPRHLTPLVPFLLLPAGLALQAARSRFGLAGLGAGLVLLSVLATGVMTLLDYIPDSLTNALHDVALPLLWEGYLPHNPLTLLGVPNPWAALPLLAAMGSAAVGAAWLLLARDRRLLSGLVAVATVLVLGGAHAAFRPQGAARVRDEETYRFLKQRYVPRPGQPPPALWGSPSP